MADEKKGMGPEGPIVPESPAPESPDGRPVLEPAAEQEVIPGMGDSLAPPGPGNVVVDFEKINELMAEKRAAARDTVEHEETPAPGAGTPADGTSGAVKISSVPTLELLAVPRNPRNRAKKRRPRFLTLPPFPGLS